MWKGWRWVGTSFKAQCSRHLYVCTCPNSLNPASTASEVSLQRHLVLPPLVAVQVLLPVRVAGASSLGVGRVVYEAGSLEQTVSDQSREAELLTSLSPLPGWYSGTLRADRASLGPADCRSMLALSMASTWGTEMVVKTGH